MPTYIIKYEKGEKVVYEDGRKLSPKELKAYEKGKEDNFKELTMVCNNCGKHGYSLAKKNGEPRKKKCPECGEQMVQNFNVLVKKDESQIRRKVQRFNHYGMDKDQAHAFYNSAIESSKKRMNGLGAASHYTPMVPDMDYMVKHGIAKPADSSEVAKQQRAVTSEVSKVVEKNKSVNLKRSNNSQTIK